MTFQPTPVVEATLQGLDTDVLAFIHTLLQAARSSTQANLIPLKSAKPETYYGLCEASALTPDAWLFQMRQYIELHNQSLDHAVPFAATFL